MKHLFKGTYPNFYTSILYICSFFLFLEWIYPLEQVSDTRNITVFIVYALYCFVISIIPLKWGYTFLLKGFGLLFILHELYFDLSFINPAWLLQLISELIINIEAIFSQQWQLATPLFRSFLFLILVWLMSYLLFYWFVQAKRFFLFILMTFIYVAVLDTFTVYDAGIAIVRTFIISLIALGIANFMKELQQQSIAATVQKKVLHWLIPIVVFIIFSSAIGFLGPKFSPQWPDPVPFIKSTAEGVRDIGSGVVQKVGYGEDDSRLGGSFVQDDEPVFRAAVGDKQYWRIETKDVYTGKGWELSSEPEYTSVEGNNLGLQTVYENVMVEEQEGIVELQNLEIEKLIYPYGTEMVDELTELNPDYHYDPISEAVETEFNNDGDRFDYQVTFYSPSFDINQLRASTDEDPKEIKERFTQLPSTLPERVGDLAEELTAAFDNRYDKVKAIERYFSHNGYVYQTTDVPVPEGNEDYVDQFLFESKVGYCDNFSTSMIVMLRTLDIPARWVKGFSGGEMIENRLGDELDIYEITNANAHSWVEVYFPEVGWVPFEPTQGFSNLTDFYTDTNSEGSAAEDEDLESTDTPELEEEEEEVVDEEKDVTISENNDRSLNIFSRWFVIGGIVLFGLVGFIIYQKRRIWQTKVMLARLENQLDAKSFQDAYHYLLKLLKDKGYERAPNLTLREYAQQVDKIFETDEMKQLTLTYERMLYKNEVDQVNSQDLTKLWKNLINRITG